MSGGGGQNPYAQGGYGYMGQGQGGGQYDQQAYQQQQAYYQQQMYMQQQQYGGQQQQWGGGGGGYGQQQQYQQQQYQQQYQQPEAEQSKGGSKGSGGGKGGGGGKGSSKGGGDGGGVDAIRSAMSGGGGGGGGGSQPKKAAKPSTEMTMDEYKAHQAAEKERKAAERKEKEAKAKADAAARAANPEAAALAAPPAGAVQVLKKGEDMPAAKKEAPKKEEPKKEAPAPAAKAPEADVEDWEDQADEEPAPAPKEEPKVEPKKEEPKPEPKKEEPKAAPVVVAAPEPEEDPEEAAAAAAAVAEPVNEGDLKEPDPRLHLNVVFIGHVDAGKSTTCGNILFLSNCVDERTVEKYMKEAKDKNRESWFLAYIMDTNDEEKAKGKTVEVGRAHFETENRRFTILDAPGHKSYVPNMIAGASQADIGVLIISARKGEFETGFERGGQTREHALLAKTLGVEKLLLCINKMDDPSVEWSKARYDEIETKMTPFLKTSGFKEDQVIFLPISGLKGHNIKERLDTPDWFKGATLLETIDKAEIPRSSKEASLRIPMLDGYRDMGAVMAIGKVEQGTVRAGQKCIIMPIGQKCTVHTAFINEEAMKYAKVGENVTLKMMGCTEEQLTKGFVLCAANDPVRVVTKFKAMLQVIELSEERPVLTAGYQAVIHCHVANEECEILKINEACPMNNMKKKEKKPKFVRENSVAWVTIKLARPTAVDAFTGCSQLGRFTLRDEGRTIAIGKIIELPKTGGDDDDDKPSKK